MIDSLYLFKKRTDYDLSVFFSDFKNFISNYYKDIDSYYEGGFYDKRSFLELDRLIKESITIDSLFSINKTYLSMDTSFWDILSDFEDIRTKLQSIKNLGKWKRSSYVFGYDIMKKNSYILNKNQTLEDLSNNSGERDYQDNWVDIAITNKLREIDYNKEGGNTLSISSNLNGKITTPNYGIVDYSNQDLILGKDIVKELEFIDDDINCVSDRDCLLQSAEICIQITKGSVPELPYLGYSKEIVGSQLSNIMIPTIIRDLVNSFKTDKTFDSVNLLSVNREADVVRVEVDITSINGVELNINT